jgi:hypothetical protein
MLSFAISAITIKFTTTIYSSRYPREKPVALFNKKHCLTRRGDLPSEQVDYTPNFFYESGKIIKTGLKNSVRGSAA